MWKVFLQIMLLFCVFALPGHLFAGVQGQVDVFVSIPPQKWLCEQLGKERVKTNVLLDKGQEPHGFQPSPRQIQALSGARLFFTVGLRFEQEIVRRLQDGSADLQIVDTSKNINKIPMDPATHEHGEDCGHDHGVAPDPHVWLSPPNLKSMASLMAEALIGKDPGHESFYRKNLSQLNTLLDTLDKSLEKKLAPYDGKSFYVFHPAFGYFAHRYHLQQVAVETGGKSPTPKQLFALIRKAQKDGVNIIFVQAQFDPSSAISVAKGIGGEVAPLDPLAENVPENLKSMGAAIVQAFLDQKTDD